MTSRARPITSPGARPDPNFPGPAKGGFDTQPIGVHGANYDRRSQGPRRVYMPDMGFRNNNAPGIAINDEAEGIYYVVDGTRYDSGCCFDYGNSSINGHAVGTGAIETAYFAASTA